MKGLPQTSTVHFKVHQRSNPKLKTRADYQDMWIYRFNSFFSQLVNNQQVK